MSGNETPVHIYVLADGAAYPLRLAALLREAGTEFRNVYAGLPEEEAGDASLFLAHVTDADAPWLAELDAMDLQAPCLTLIWSRADIDALAKHLRQFLIADIGDGMTALIRYYDPRNLLVTMEVWGDEISDKLMWPIEQWKYRGHSETWERIDGPADGCTTQTAPLPIQLTQEQLDRFVEHCEPDQLLAALVENGIAPQDGPYLPRFTNFLHRYQKAAAWGLTEPADRLRFCELSYRYGPAFDEHSNVRIALEERMRSSSSMAACEEGIHPTVWEQLLAKAPNGK
ncbi:DUF4123 domain-containing protein [Ralstonia sp. UBA689]|uniref:DUF4123 domain-containing protein n=1 Tax=Ralstonia sp. UBA689 TaxID=1947373 RepID=UPI0025DFFD2C|nr:DUF4123 domain-containing protein [Ralstonia sp. UBA689]